MRRLPSDPTDLDRYIAAKKFVMWFVDRRTVVSDSEAIENAILKAAEAIPPFTKINRAALAGRPDGGVRECANHSDPGSQP